MNGPFVSKVVCEITKSYRTPATDGSLCSSNGSNRAALAADDVFNLPSLGRLGQRTCRGVGVGAVCRCEMPFRLARTCRQRCVHRGCGCPVDPHSDSCRRAARSALVAALPMVVVGRRRSGARNGRSGDRSRRAATLRSLPGRVRNRRTTITSRIRRAEFRRLPS